MIDGTSKTNVTLCWTNKVSDGYCSGFITTKIKIAGAIPGPSGSVLNIGIQPNELLIHIKKGLRNGSITNIAHKPSTTEGIAASSSTIIPINSLIRLGKIFSVRNIAVPKPSGIAISKEAIEETIVPYIDKKHPIPTTM